MKEITLKDAWENRDEVVRRCEENNACEIEFDKLKKAIEELNEEDYLKIIQYNFNWLNEKKVLNYNSDYCYNFYDGFAVIEIDGKCGFLKENGDYLIEPKFDNSYSFLNGFAVVKLDGKYGFIKNDGEYLVEPKFDDCCHFTGGFAQVKIDNEWKKLDINGNIHD